MGGTTSQSRGVLCGMRLARNNAADATGALSAALAAAGATRLSDSRASSSRSCEAASDSPTIGRECFWIPGKRWTDQPPALKSRTRGTGAGGAA